MKPLAWVEQEGVWKAEANGFEYQRRVKRYDYPPLIEGHPGRMIACWEAVVGGLVDPRALNESGAIEACQSHANAVQAAIDAALAKERENADRLAKALEEASFVLSMSIGMDLPFMPKQEPQPGSPKAMIDEALAAHKELHKPATS